MHRRRFLNAMGAGLLAGMMPAPGMRVARAGIDARRGRALVVVFLRGGCDGLNVVVPYGEDAYHNARPTLGIQPPGPGDPGSALDIDGFFGLHPALAPLHRRYQEGLVALLPAVHLPGLDRSHFSSQAGLEQAGGSDGWLGRYLATDPGAAGEGEASGLAVATAPPLALQGPRRVAAYPDPFDLRLANNPRGDALLERILVQAYGASPAPEGPAGDWAGVAAVLRADRGRGRVRVPTAVHYPEGPFGAGLAASAQLLATDPGLAVVTLDLGGWDTHRNQGGAGGNQARLLETLAQGLDAFLTHLGPRRNDVAVLVQTEFGRTLEENASGGTDHGHAGAWLVVGGNVQGGIHGGTGWPGLHEAALVNGRYLAGATDYRDVYADLLTRHLGAPHLDAILPGHVPTPLGLTGL